MEKISVKIDDELFNLINDYSIFIDLDLSKTVRELLKEGLMVKAQTKLLLNWNKKIINRPLILNKCDKCGINETLQFYHINGDITNFNNDNIAIICKKDLRKLQKSIMNYNPREKFLRWFFFEN
jgi:hypothetical protein